MWLRCLPRGMLPAPLVESIAMAWGRTPGGFGDNSVSGTPSAPSVGESQEPNRNEDRWGRTPQGFGDNPVPSAPSVGEQQEPNRSQIGAWTDPNRPNRIGVVPPSETPDGDQGRHKPVGKSGRLTPQEKEHNARLLGVPVRKSKKKDEEEGVGPGDVARAGFSLLTGGPLGFLGAMAGMFNKSRKSAQGATDAIEADIQSEWDTKNAVNRELGWFSTREVDPNDERGMAALALRQDFNAQEAENLEAFGGPPDGPTATGIPDSGARLPAPRTTVPGAAATPEEERTPVDDALNREVPTFTATTDWLEELRRANEAVSRRTVGLV